MPASSPATIYHITSPALWGIGATAGEYRSASLESEGFIHLSTAEQVERSLRRFFADARELVLLHVDAAMLGDALRYEPADGQLFPHLYGPLPIEAVVHVETLGRSGDDQWSSPLDSTNG